MSKLRGAELQQLWFVGEAVRAESLFSKYAELLLTPWRPLRYPHPHPPLRRSLIMVGNESGHFCKCHNGIFLLSPLIWQHATCFFTGVCSCCFLINSLADILLAGSFFFFFFFDSACLRESKEKDRERKREGGLSGYASLFPHVDQKLKDKSMCPLQQRLYSCFQFNLLNCPLSCPVLPPPTHPPFSSSSSSSIHWHWFTCFHSDPQ